MSADRDQDALTCAALRREREAAEAARGDDPDRYVCHCDHSHPPDAGWCDLCEFPLRRTAHPPALEGS